MDEDNYDSEETDYWSNSDPEEGHWNDGEYDESTNWQGDHYDEKGCCLTCADSHQGCMCYNCRCSKCDYHSDYNGKCLKINELQEEREKEMASNIEVVFTVNEFGHTLIKIRTIGPVNKENYAEFKPFFREHNFRWSNEMHCYWQYSENWRFIRLLRQELTNCGFISNEKIEDTGEILDV
jgi:hypothetical protein